MNLHRDPSGGSKDSPWPPGKAQVEIVHQHQQAPHVKGLAQETRGGRVGTIRQTSETQGMTGWCYRVEIGGCYESYFSDGGGTTKKI